MCTVNTAQDIHYACNTHVGVTYTCIYLRERERKYNFTDWPYLAHGGHVARSTSTLQVNTINK